MHRIRFGKLLGQIVIVYALYALITCSLVPLFGGQNKEGGQIGSTVSVGTGMEQVVCIDDNTDALIWRLRVIESAQKELILTTFHFADDNSGQRMMAALKQAANRGVQIRILIDGIYGRLALFRSAHFKALASSQNVEVKLYNPVNLLTPWTANYRMHDKYLIADETAYILGGRNTTDLFLGDYQDKQNTDRDILVYAATPGENNSVHQVIEYFEQVWALPCNKTLSYDAGSTKVKTAALELEARYASLFEEYPILLEATDWLNETIPVNGVYFLSNPIHAGNKTPTLWQSLCEIMRGREEIIIQTPYIICSNEMYDSLAQISAEAAQIQILTNAVENGANPWGCSDYLNQKKKILATGAEVFEYIGAHSLHTKAIVMDDSISMIGSFNMDMRSTYLDTETMLLIDSPQINESLRQCMQEQMEQSKHVMPDGSETAGSNYTASNVHIGKKLFYTLLRILIIPFRHLL